MNTAGQSRRIRPEADGLSDEMLADVLARSSVRTDVVAQARARLQSRESCPAEKIAAELVDCYVDRRLP